MIIVFLGADGSGKSSVIATLSNITEEDFRDVDQYHLFPTRKLGRFDAAAPVIEPHALAARGLLVSVLKLFYYLLLYIGGYWLNIRARSRAGWLIVFDRYYHDLLVDPRRYRYGGPMWLARWVGKLIPQPDLWILLDAPTEVLQARKQEVSHEETARQRQGYLELVRDMNNGVIVDASRPLDQVAAAVKRVILERAFGAKGQCRETAPEKAPTRK